ncbi:MAG: hypothetical protein JJU12_05025 [Chlamydiales bacterium]|nr:hypothetical protein [Chlamydiales bacterium]
MNAKTFSFMLRAMDGKVSSFEGFLHRSDEGWLLCDAPNLKSCCLKKHAVVKLEGDFSNYPSDKAVVVKGVYESGTLAEAAVREKNSHFPYWSLGAVLLLCCLWSLFKLRPFKSRKGRPLPP